ncbi:hypothetical protein JXJ21_25735 [candidate division KSB1 bacterium]|nr:hypothetical protein [candidate division KSB1 bacterium]
MTNKKRAPDGVQWTIAIPPEVKCEYAETSIGEYFQNIDVMLITEQRCREKFIERYEYDPGEYYYVPFTAYEGVAALGATLVFTDQHEVMIENQGNILTEPAHVMALAPADPWKYPRFVWGAESYRQMKTRFPDKSVGISPGQEGPVTSAVLLRGTRFFMDCYDAPELAHRLLSVVTDTFIHFCEAVSEVTGQRSTALGIADDHSGNLAPQMWDEFVLPYYERIYSELDIETRVMHSELVRREHFPYLEKLNLSQIDLGEDPYISVADALSLGKPFFWHIKTCQEMLMGNPDSIKRAYENAVNEGAKGILTELSVGVPPENIRAFIDVARKFEPV